MSATYDPCGYKPCRCHVTSQGSKPAPTAQAPSPDLAMSIRYACRKFTEWCDAGGKPNPGLILAMDQLERAFKGEPSPPLDPQTIESVKRGLEQADRGEVTDMGSFAKYAEEESVFDLAERLHAAMKRGGWANLHAHGLAVSYTEAHGPLVGDYPIGRSVGEILEELENPVPPSEGREDAPSDPVQTQARQLWDLLAAYSKGHDLLMGESCGCKLCSAYGDLDWNERPSPNPEPEARPAPAEGLPEAVPSPSPEDLAQRARADFANLRPPAPTQENHP